MTDTKLYVPVVTLSTQDNAKLLDQLKSGFKRTINWFLVDPSFQGINRLFVLPFGNDARRTSYKRYYLPTKEIKKYNFMIYGQNFLDLPVRNDLITYDYIRKIAAGQGGDYTTGCLLDYNYFKNYYKMIAIDLSKEQPIYVDPKSIQQINSTGNLEQQATTIFIIGEAKETVLHFHKEL